MTDLPDSPLGEASNSTGNLSRFHGSDDAQFLPSATHTETASVGNPVSVKAKVAWALGSLGDNYAMQTINVLKDPVYTVSLRMPADQLGYALMIPRILDAFLDPLIGYISDNWSGKWGRRRPFILAGAVPLSVFGVLLWQPSLHWSQSHLFLFFLVVTMLYYVGYSLFVVPYRALGLELTKDYHERTRVQSWGMYIGLVGGLGIPWIYKLSLIIGGVRPGVINVAPEAVLRGAGWVGLLIGVLMFSSCVAPAIFCRETIRAVGGEKISLGRALIATARNRAFAHMLGMNFMAIIAVLATGPLGTPLMIYYLFHGDQSAAASLGGWAGNVTVVGAFLGVMFNTRLSSRIGKHYTAIVCLAISMVAAASQWITMNPTHPYAMLYSAFFNGWGLQGVWLMTASMNADVCDEDEVRTHHRREGLYGAVFALEQKLAFGLAAGLGGFLAVRCGYTAGTPGSSEVLIVLKQAFVFTQLVFLSFAIMAIAFYPLTRQRLQEIRGHLNARLGDQAL